MALTDFNYFLLLRLVVAALLGSLIGLERGRKKHEAGLRTHIILCLGSASIMVISESLVKQYGNVDIMRMGAQVISGVGFLGLGGIITDRHKVKGITTAAGLWTTACVGLAVGIGYYIIAVATVLIMLFAMFGLHSLSAKLESYSSKSFIVKIDLSSREAIISILSFLGNEGIEIDSVKLEENKDDISLIFDIKFHNIRAYHSIMCEVLTIDGVKECSSL